MSEVRSSGARRRARRHVLLGSALVASGLAGALGPRFLSAPRTQVVPEGAVRPRAGDLTWGDKDFLLVLSSVGCPHCAAWEASELEAARAAGALILRDAPRTSEALAAAVFLRSFADPGRRLAARARMHVRGGGEDVLRDAEAGTLGGEGLAGLRSLADAATLAEAGLEAARDRLAFGVAGMPTFVREGFAPILGNTPAAELAVRMPAGGRPSPPTG